MDLSIIVVNYNAYVNIKISLNSLYKIIKENGWEVILLDNNSLDRSIDQASKDFSRINLITLNENLGFAKANNTGVKNSKFEFLCFLNPDTILTEDFISPIISFLRSNNTAGACAPMLVYENGSYQPSSGFRMGFIYEFLEATMLIELYRKFKRSKYLSLKSSNEPVKVGWVSGACFVIRKAVFEEVGGFTEDYFLNYEDIDLCRKLEEKGYSNFYFPQYQCVHLDHKSFDSNFELLVFTRYESRLIYAHRNYSFFLQIIVRFLHIWGILLRLFFVYFKYNGNELKSRKKGYLKSLKLFIGFSNK